VKKPGHRDAALFASATLREKGMGRTANLAAAYLDLRSRARSMERFQKRLRKLLIRVDHTIAEMGEHGA